MWLKNNYTLKSGLFITFSGNCKAALMFYQACFGGALQLDIFDQELGGYAEKPVIRGSLVSDSIVIYGSDMVMTKEGRSGIISRSFCCVKMQGIEMRLLRN